MMHKTPPIVGLNIATQFGLLAAAAGAFCATTSILLLKLLHPGTVFVTLVSVLVPAILAGLVCSLVALRWARQINSVIDAVDALSDGDYQADFEATSSGDEIGLLTRRFSNMRERLYTHQRGLKHKARRDRLTGLFNRAYLDKQLPLLAKWAEDQNADLTALMIDLDNFKQWNDALGHAGGDDVLRLVGASLQEYSRSTDLVVRVGGDEFVIIVPGMDLLGATNIGERLRRNIRDRLVRQAEQEFKLSSTRRDELGIAPITMSIGVATFNGNIDELLVHADAALYDAKRHGRDQVKVYNESRAAA